MCGDCRVKWIAVLSLCAAATFEKATAPKTRETQEGMVRYHQMVTFGALRRPRGEAQAWNWDWKAR
jgi:hypothetical protein